ncbi:MAG: hypothetical protein ABFE07_08945 [Armatimonadia bacterium]
MHPDAERLFALDADLRREADYLLAQSGIGSILRAHGLSATGSYIMRTMTWRDLDFEAYKKLDQASCWKLGEEIANSPWTFHAQFEDNHRTGYLGFYWGFLIADPSLFGPVQRGNPLVWKLDAWSFPVAHRANNDLERRALWQSLLDDESRACVVAIKEVLCHDDRYCKSLFSVDIYEAVLEQGIRDLEAFEQWFAERQ